MYSDPFRSSGGLLASACLALDLGFVCAGIACAIWVVNDPVSAGHAANWAGRQIWVFLQTAFNARA
jgi:hypothetical protein